MGAIASRTISLTIVFSTVYSDADQRKHQSSASLAFVRGIHRGPVNSSHKWPVARKMFPFDDVIMIFVLSRFPLFISGTRVRHQRYHYGDVIINAMASQTTSLTIVLLNRLLRRYSKKTSKLRVTGFYAGNPPVTGEFPAQMASNAENVSIWWRHYVGIVYGPYS